jgi:hypothetical protein
LDFVTNGDSRFRIEPTGQIKAVYESTVGTDYNTTLHNGYFCRAWANFNGTGTPAIRASGNVSSLTDNGVGDYTVNFTTAMPDANYNLVGGAGAAGDQNDVHPVNFRDSVTVPATGSARVQVATRGSALTDQQRVSVSFFM